MKYLPSFLAAAILLPAGEFVSGQAARLVIGQRTFTEQASGASAVLVGGPSGLAYGNNTLIVADSNRVGALPLNHRVLIYSNIHAKLPGVTDALPPTFDRCPACLGEANVVLGQKDFEKSDLVVTPDDKTLRLPTAVATDGVRLVVADTDNNRVLIWNSIPTSNYTPANVVLGFDSFTALGARRPPTASTLLGPQGVWIQGSRLLVADTQNHRVLIWNSIPTRNGQPADMVLGAPDFTTFVELDLTKTELKPKADNLLNPVSVTSDGQRIVVSDLGHDRVLIWNSFPAKNGQPADLVLGQPDFETAAANNSEKLCAALPPEDPAKPPEKPDYPARCLATMNFPRYALSDGKRLFIADGGNDRILVYNQLPASNGQAADLVLGQNDGAVNRNSDSAAPLYRASADTIRTPSSLAWDGTNLFASDPYNRRILVYSLAEKGIPFTGVRNAASKDVYAVGTIAFSGNIKEGDEIKVKIRDKEYKRKNVKDDTFDKIITALVALINAGDGDPAVVATANLSMGVLVLTARAGGEDGNSVEYSVTTSTDAQILATTGGANLAGGGDAAKIAPGSLVAILGDDLAETTVSVPEDVETLPTELAGVQVYFDGMRAPLRFVSPSQITAQIPWEVRDRTGINAWVRIERKDGTVVAKTPVAVPIINQNPGIFAEEGIDPRPGLVYHYSSHATGTVSVDGTAKAGDIARVTIEDRTYSYTVKEGDTLASIRDGLIEEINKDEKVAAYPAGMHTRIRLRARVPGPEGNGIKIGASGSPDSGAQVIITPTNEALCCANSAGAPVTEDNPALPGETIVVFGTGLGYVKPVEAANTLATGRFYAGPELNEPVEFVSSLAGGKTANVLYAGLRPGTIGLYEVHLELNSDIPTNARTQVTIAQDVYVSNIVTFPVLNPRPSESVKP